MRDKTQNLDWLASADLTDYRRCGESRFVEAASPYQDAEPWCRIKEPNVRTRAILLWLQNNVLRDARKKDASFLRAMESKLKGTQADLKSAKAALTNEMLQGATVIDYAECWAAWAIGDETKLQKAVAEVERKRTEWRSKCLKEAKEKLKARLRKGCSILRERAPGFAMPVNWFSGTPVYNQDVHNGQLLWGYCQATGQGRAKVGGFLKAKRQKPVEFLGHKGAGRRLPLYGFETNMLVLDKWLGDWLLASPERVWRNWPDAERVCEAIDNTLFFSVHLEHSSEQAERFRAVLREHWKRWKGRVKDKDTLVAIPFVGAALVPGVEAWNKFVEKQKEQRRTNRGKRPFPSLPPPLDCPQPYEDVKASLERHRELKLPGIS